MILYDSVDYSYLFMGANLYKISKFTKYLREFLYNSPSVLSSLSTIKSTRAVLCPVQEGIFFAIIN